MFGLHKINNSANTHSRISQDQGLFIYAYIQPTSHSRSRSIHSSVGEVKVRQMIIKVKLIRRLDVAASPRDVATFSVAAFLSISSISALLAAVYFN